MAKYIPMISSMFGFLEKMLIFQLTCQRSFGGKPLLVAANNTKTFLSVRSEVTAGPEKRQDFRPAFGNRLIEICVFQGLDLAPVSFSEALFLLKFLFLEFFVAASVFFVQSVALSILQKACSFRIFVLSVCIGNKSNYGCGCKEQNEYFGYEVFQFILL